MPTPRKYANDAERQAAYRIRTAQALAATLAERGLPTSSPIPAMPSYRRWRAMARSGRNLFATILDEMQRYAECRSEEWQESERAEEFGEQIELVDELIETIDGLSI